MVILTHTVTVSFDDTLYASDVAVTTMVMALRQLVSRRISLCQQVIVLYHLYKLVCYVSASYCIVSSLQAGMLCISKLLYCITSTSWYVMYYNIGMVTVISCEPDHVITTVTYKWQFVDDEIII